MSKILIFVFLVFSISCISVCALDEKDISAECAVVLNVDNGEVLFSKNHNKQHSMASTTKIMTSLLAIESNKLQHEVLVSKEMVSVEGTSMGLLPGDSVSLRELVYGMMLSSGNDAANATATYLGGSLYSFADMMNKRAKEIGMNDSCFVTPSGLDSENHYSTAYDMALLGMTAVKNPLFVSICSDKKETITFGNPPYSRTLYNHNKLLNYYDYALGIKTGFTKKSGRCLVSYARKGSAELIAVTLNAPDDWNDHILMFDTCFGELNNYKIDPDIPERLPVVGSSVSSVQISTEEFVYSSTTEVELTSRVYIEKFLYAPTFANKVVGYCEYFVNGERVTVKPIVIK